MGVTSAITAGCRACTSLRDAIDLPMPMPRNPSARPKHDVLAFIISLPFVYGVLPGIGSQQYATDGFRSAWSRHTVQLISTYNWLSTTTITGFVSCTRKSGQRFNASASRVGTST
jgi:hypothetical protein